MKIVAAVLAAGASRRLGTPKQLLSFRGEPLVRHALATLALPEVAETAVVLGANGAAVAAVLDDRTARVWNASWEEGMASSIRAAVAWAREQGATALILALADQPLVEPSHVARLIAALGGGAMAAASAYSGTIGVPAAFDARLFSAFSLLEGACGAASILRERNDVTIVPCPEAAVDIDTAADVDALLSYETSADQAARHSRKESLP